MQVLQAVGQLISAVIAVLGATGYVLILGAVVLWVRLSEAKFATEAPISLASREELLVIGAQALAVWVVLAVALGALAAWLASTEEVDTRNAAVGLLLGSFFLAVTLAAIEGDHRWLSVTVAILPAIAIVVMGRAALVTQAPRAVVVAAFVPSLVGIALPLIVSWMGDRLGYEDPTLTVVAAWLLFLGVLPFVPVLKRHRELIAANATAVNQIEMESPHDDKSASGPMTPRERTVTRLLASLRESLRASRTRFWLKVAGVAALGLLLLGTVAVASQFEKDHLFRKAFVTLKGGRCLKGTYIARNDKYLVLGDQHHLPPGKVPGDNKVVLLPVGDVVEVEVRDPVDTGIRLKEVECASPPPADPPKAPEEDDERERGSTGATGAHGVTGAKGATGEPGDARPAGDVGPTGPTGERGRRGQRGPVGPRGPRGPRGRRGRDDRDG